jgi:prephenate dehydratase
MTPTIAYLGPDGSFSHEAARLLFGGDFEPRPVQNDRFAGVMHAVVKGLADGAVIPFYNSHNLDIFEAQRVFGDFLGSLYIEGFYCVRIRHNLVGVGEFYKGNAPTIYSKEQVFAQCRGFLSGMDHTPVYSDSTAQALLDVMALPEPDRAKCAAICSKFAARIYGGTVIRENINDSSNVTIFSHLSKVIPDRSRLHERLLVCVTCPTFECLNHTVEDFRRFGYLLKLALPSAWASLRMGRNSPVSPVFMEFSVPEDPVDFDRLVSRARSSFKKTIR